MILKAGRRKNNNELPNGGSDSDGLNYYLTKIKRNQPLFPIPSTQPKPWNDLTVVSGNISVAINSKKQGCGDKVDESNC
jgi:hypothetical protein